MGLDLWFREDVMRILHGLARAGERYDGEYQRGYLNALADIAVSFGVAAPDQVGAETWRVVHNVGKALYVPNRRR